MSWWLLVAAAIVAGVAFLGQWRHRHGRARALMALCRRAGLEYSPADPFGDTIWQPFHWLGGRWIAAENVVWNAAEAEAARAFDLVTRVEPAEDVQAETHRFTCAVVPLPFGCPRLEIRPRDGIDNAIGVVGDDIDLELEAFNRRFRIRCADRRFAVAFCDQRMMEAMLGLPRGVTIAVNEDRMLLRAAPLRAAEVMLLFEAARAIARRVPPVVASLYPPRPMKGPNEDRWLQGHWSPEPIGDGGA